MITIWWEGRKLRILVKSGRMQIKRIPRLSKQEEHDYLHEKVIDELKKKNSEKKDSDPQIEIMG